MTTETKHEYILLPAKLLSVTYKEIIEKINMVFPGGYIPQDLIENKTIEHPIIKLELFNNLTGGKDESLFMDNIFDCESNRHFSKSVRYVPNRQFPTDQIEIFSNWTGNKPLFGTFQQLQSNHFDLKTGRFDLYVEVTSFDKNFDMEEFDFGTIAISGDGKIKLIQLVAIPKK